MPTTFSQSPKLLKALKIKVLSKNVNKQMAKYNLSYQGVNISVVLKKVNKAVNVSVQSKKGAMIGKAKISPKAGGGLTFKVLQSKEGLAAFWVYAYTTVANQGGQVVLAYKPNDPQYMNCQYCCYKEHLAPYIATSDAYVKKQIAQNKPPKEWGVIRYIPTESFSEYDDCVEDCMRTPGSDCN